MVMRGNVDARAREASLVLQVRGRSGVSSDVRASVDTGFTGGLCLSPDLVRSLSLPLIGRGVAVSADGSAVETRVYRVLATAGGSLIGMSLLRDSKLTIEIVPGGEVEIAERSS